MTAICILARLGKTLHLLTLLSSAYSAQLCLRCSALLTQLSSALLTLLSSANATQQASTTLSKTESSKNHKMT